MCTGAGGDERWCARRGAQARIGPAAEVRPGAGSCCVEAYDPQTGVVLRKFASWTQARDEISPGCHHYLRDIRGAVVEGCVFFGVHLRLQTGGAPTYENEASYALAIGTAAGRKHGAPKTVLAFEMVTAAGGAEGGASELRVLFRFPSAAAAAAAVPGEGITLNGINDALAGRNNGYKWVGMRDVRFRDRVVVANST